MNNLFPKRSWFTEGAIKTTPLTFYSNFVIIIIIFLAKQKCNLGCFYPLLKTLVRTVKKKKNKWLGEKNKGRFHFKDIQKKFLHVIEQET